MRKHDQLYFLAIVPTGSLKIELQKLKEDFSKKYNCKTALKSPPHITLHMPFRFPEQKEELLIERLGESTKVKSFDILLNGFGCFEPRVIYINVEQIDELSLLFDQIQRTMKGLNVFNADYKNRGFNPHLTIAFRDLKKSLFPIAWNYFKDKPYLSSFNVTSFCLLKHNGKHWEEHHIIPIK